MMNVCIHFDFDYRKATQALNLIALEFGGTVNKMRAIKFIYFADRYHFRRYGRPIICDDYVAMRYGPVGSKAKDIAEFTDFLDEEQKEYCKQYIHRDGYYIESINKIDCNVFSDSDIEALKIIIKTFSKFDQFQLAEISHAFPEWKICESDLNCGIGYVDMDYNNFFQEPDIEDSIFKKYDFNKEVFFVSEQHKKSLIEYLEEQGAIKNLWR